MDADRERPGRESLDPGLLAHINIWTNATGGPSHHFQTAHLYDLEKDAWLLLLNVELRASSQAPQTEAGAAGAREKQYELILRSGHHHNKGIRTVLPGSALERRLRDRWIGQLPPASRATPPTTTDEEPESAPESAS